MSRCLWVAIIATAVAIAAAPSAQANTEPVMMSAVHATGNIIPLQKTAIKLEEEVLSIKLDGFYADVDVRYRYYNAGPADTVAYAFPLDDYLYVRKEFVVPYPRSLVTDSFRDFRITDETGHLATVEKIEQNAAPATAPRGYGPVFRRWQIAEVRFPAYSEKNVRVSYRVKNFFFGAGDPNHGQLTTLIYALSPSRHWGDGSVGRFRVILDARDNIRAGTVIKSLSLPFRDDGGLYVFEAGNFALARAGDLVVEYDETAKFAAAETLRQARENRRLSIAAVRASSAQPGDYGVENLFDGDLDTAWVAVGGAGEWLAVEYKWPRLGKLRLVNGCVNDFAAYYQNARVKKLRVEIFRKAGRVGELLWELPDRDYSTLRKSTFLSFVDALELSGYDDRTLDRDPVRIRLTILDVYPGTLSNDACISEILP